MNHASINTSALFGICMCSGSSIYGLTVTIASMVILQAAIGDLESIHRVLLVVWESTGGVSEGVFWLAHGGY